jgi:cytochrome c-type biogenesis protein CcmH/NrfG
MLPAYRLCEQALAIDSRNVRALVILALRHLVLARNLQSDDPQTDRLKAGELISRALAVDSNNYLAHYARAFFLAEQSPEEAIAEGERVLALNPSFIPVYIPQPSVIWRR